MRRGGSDPNVYTVSSKSKESWREQMIGGKAGLLSTWVDSRELAVEYGGWHSGFTPPWLRDGGEGRGGENSALSSGHNDHLS